MGHICGIMQGIIWLSSSLLTEVSLWKPSIYIFHMELLWVQMFSVTVACVGSRRSYVLFTEQLQIISLWRAPHSPLSLQHLQLCDVSSLMALHHGCRRVHCEFLHPDNTSGLWVNQQYDDCKQLLRWATMVCSCIWEIYRRVVSVTSRSTCQESSDEYCELWERNMKMMMMKNFMQALGTHVWKASQVNKWLMKESLKNK